MFQITGPHLAARSAATIAFADQGEQNSRIEIYDTSNPQSPRRLCVFELAKPCGTIVNNRVNPVLSDPVGAFVDFGGIPDTAIWLSGSGEQLGTCTVSGPDGAGDIQLRNRDGTGELYQGGRVTFDPDVLIG